MSLYNTYVDYVGNGAVKDYAVPFAYIDVNDIVVTVGGVEVEDPAFTLSNPNTVHFAAAPANGAAVRIERSTTINAARVVFSNGSSTTAQQLNRMVVQLLYALQEAVDRSIVGFANAEDAVDTANAADAKATTALSTANTALTTANTSITTANNAASTATTAAAAAAAAQVAAQAAAASANVHTASDLPYVNTTSGLSATDVQHAIDLIAAATGVVEITTDVVDNLSSVAGDTASDALDALAGLITALSASLKTVALTGAYADLTGKPTLFSGAFSALTGKPTTVAGYGITDALAFLNVAQSWTKQQTSALATITDQATLAWDVSGAQKAKVTLGGNRTMGAVTNAVEGTTYYLWVIQDATGSRTITWTTTGAGSFDFGAVGAPTLTTTASKADLLVFEAISIAGTLKLRYVGSAKAFT